MIRILSGNLWGIPSSTSKKKQRIEISICRKRNGVIFEVKEKKKRKTTNEKKHHVYFLISFLFL